MKKEIKNWENSFIEEFGIHFSISELQFVLEFIKETIKAEKQKWAKREYKKGYEDGWNDLIRGENKPF